MWKSLVLCDGTMVTGDSGGNVQFWDAQLGTRTAAFQACSQPPQLHVIVSASHNVPPPLLPCLLQQQMLTHTGSCRCDGRDPMLFADMLIHSTVKRCVTGSAGACGGCLGHGCIASWRRSLCGWH